MKLSRLSVAEGTKRFDATPERKWIKEVGPCRCGCTRAVKRRDGDWGCIRCGRDAEGGQLLSSASVQAKKQRDPLGGF